MRRRLIAGFLAFAVVAMVLVEVPLGISLADNARSTALSELQDGGTSLGLLVGSALDRRDVGDARALVDQFSRSSHAIVIVVANGRAELSAGRGAVEEMADPATSPLLRAAQRGKISGEEGSRDPDDNLLYVALPITAKEAGDGSGSGGSRFGAVLLAAEPAGPLNDRIAGDWLKLSLFGVAMLTVAAGLAIVLARSLTEPLARVESAVAAIGLGRLSERAPSDAGPAELRALADTVNEMADRLDELMHAQRAFVADASHQLRTPMTALRLRLENLEQHLEGDEAGDLTAAVAEADRLSRVVDGLLSLARADGTRPARERIDVEAVVRERVEAWSALAEERGVALSEAVAPDAAAAAPVAAAGPAARPAAAGPAAPASRAGAPATTALACPGFLEQVLDNLLSNALDATPPGGTVSLRTERVGDEVEVHVVDTGPGMSATDRARAFDRFWRKDESARDGTGLGLAIAAQLVRASGGATWLDEAEGGGVDAVVRLEAG